jgi:hypothetical protein
MNRGFSTYPANLCPECRRELLDACEADLLPSLRLEAHGAIFF